MSVSTTCANVMLSSHWPGAKTVTAHKSPTLSNTSARAVEDIRGVSLMGSIFLKCTRSSAQVTKGLHWAVYGLVEGEATKGNQK